MKKFELTFTYRDEYNKPIFYDNLKGDSLLEILSQFLLTLNKAHEKIVEEIERKVGIDDDIPF